MMHQGDGYTDDWKLSIKISTRNISLEFPFTFTFFTTIYLRESNEGGVNFDPSSLAQPSIIFIMAGFWIKWKYNDIFQ